MEGKDGFKMMVLGYKRQEMPFLGRRLLKLGENENGRGGERKKWGEGVLEMKKIKKRQGWKLEVKLRRMK